MSDGNGAKNGTANEQPAQPQIQARIVNQYLKDLSFENPNVRKVMTQGSDQPTLKVEFNVQAGKLDGDLFESAIELKATASNNLGTIYVLETTYAGLFKIETIPEQALQPFLLISGPTMIFPFLRRLVADITREGGYPPLLLDPIDFAGLYFKRQNDIRSTPQTVTS